MLAVPHAVCVCLLYPEVASQWIASAHFCFPVDLFCPRLNQWRMKCGRETSGQFWSIHRIYKLKCTMFSMKCRWRFRCYVCHVGRILPEFFWELRCTFTSSDQLSITYDCLKIDVSQKNGIFILWTGSLHLYWRYDDSVCQKSFVTCFQLAYRVIYLTHWSTYYRACVERLMPPTSRYV